MRYLFAMRQGFYLPFSQTPDTAASLRALAAVSAMRENLLSGISDIIPSYLNIYIEFDSSRLTKSRVKSWAEQHLKSAKSWQPSRTVDILVYYNGADLEWVATQTGLSVPEVIRLHSSQTYHAFGVGFTPGFPFLGVLPEQLRLPRRGVPRQHVPAHSVGIAAAQTGVYPSASPGGWHLLGTAGVAMYDPERQSPFFVQAGDAVRFVPSQTLHVPPPPQLQRLMPTDPTFPALRLEEAGLQSFLLDLGRTLVGHWGLAQSGVLDARSAARANALVGNFANTPLLELTLTGGVWTALRDLVLGFAGYGMIPLVEGSPIAPASSFALRTGQTLRFAPTSSGVRGYLAIAGGFEAKAVWGSVSPDPRAMLGKALQTGDVLGCATPKSTRVGYSLHQPALEPARIRLQLGSQPNFETIKALCNTQLILERGNRMGLQLGAAMALEGGDVPSEATPLGAVQMTATGKVLVLLADRGRMGGYAKPAVVHPADLWRLAQVRDGETLRFSHQVL